MMTTLFPFGNNTSAISTFFLSTLTGTYKTILNNNDIAVFPYQL
jgi:hypothetical protein